MQPSFNSKTGGLSGSELVFLSVSVTPSINRFLGRPLALYPDGQTILLFVFLYDQGLAVFPPYLFKLSFLILSLLILFTVFLRHLISHVVIFRSWLLFCVFFFFFFFFFLWRGKVDSVKTAISVNVASWRSSV